MVRDVYSSLVGEDVLFVVFMKGEFTHVVAGLGLCGFDECDAGADVLLLLNGQGSCSAKLGAMLALLTARACGAPVRDFMHFVRAPSADVDEVLSGQWISV